MLCAPAAKDRERRQVRPPSFTHREFTCSWESALLSLAFLGTWFCPRVTHRDIQHRACCVQAPRDVRVPDENELVALH